MKRGNDMRLMNLFKTKRPDFYQGIREYNSSPGAILLDVRSSREYQSGHIPGSHNVPLKRIEDVADLVDSKDAKIFVYCQSGARSSQATSALKNMGYANAKNIGGMAAYRGRIVK